MNKYLKNLGAREEKEIPCGRKTKRRKALRARRRGEAEEPILDKELCRVVPEVVANRFRRRCKISLRNRYLLPSRTSDENMKAFDRGREVVQEFHQ